MKNADMPANATNQVLGDYEGTVNCPYNKPLAGLTKREAFAIAAMQGILSGGQGVYDEGVKSKCKIAVEYADALLNELSKGEL